MSDSPSIPTIARGLLTWFLIATPAVALLFLWWSAFFASWNGYVVSVRPSATEDPAAFQVLIVDSNGDGFETWWPAELVKQLDLKVNNTGVPPLDPSGPWSTKTRFGWSYTVEKPAPPPPETDEGAEPPEAQPLEKLTRSTLTAGTVGVAFLAWIVSLALRNIYTSGSPVGFAPRERLHIEGSTRRATVNLRQYPTEPVPLDPNEAAKSNANPQGPKGPRGPQPPPRSRNVGRR